MLKLSHQFIGFDFKNLGAGLSLNPHLTLNENFLTYIVNIT